jgi:hypothetical protein
MSASSRAVNSLVTDPISKTVCSVTSTPDQTARP